MNAAHPYVVQAAPSHLGFIGGILIATLTGLVVSKSLVGSSHAQFLAQQTQPPAVLSIVSPVAAPGELATSAVAEHDEVSPLVCCALFSWRSE